MFGFGSEKGLVRLKFDNPAGIPQEAFNQLVEIVSELDHEEDRWEEIIEKALEGQPNTVKIETLLRNMEEKHGNFEERLSLFEQKADERRKQASGSGKKMATIEKVTDNIGQRASGLDDEIEEVGQHVREGDLQPLGELMEDLEQDRQRTEKELENLRKELA